MNTFVIKHKYIILGLIFLLGAFLRFYMLGTNPPSLNWDEVSTGYNAYSILKTGKDEYGSFLPLSIRSFDDYKPPLYTYLDVPFIAAFGVTEVAVRLPSAILGTATILIVYFLVLQLFPFKKEKQARFDLSFLRQEVALVAAFWFAISPWSIQFSRAAYEGNIGLFFLLGGVLFFLKSLETKWYLYISTLFFVLSMYSYHSFRLMVPLLLFVMVVLFAKQLLKIKTTVIFSLIIFTFLVLPIFYSLLASGSGTGSRLSMVTLFGASPNLDHSITQLEYDKQHGDVLGELLHNRRVVYALAITKGYLDHYNPDFLFLHGDGGRQHHAVDMGMMYLLDLPLLLLGLLVIGKHITRRTLLLFFFVLLAPLPSAITTGTPHPVRAIALLPGFIILCSIGLVFLLSKVSSMRHKVVGVKVRNVVFPALFLLFSFNFVYYLHQYYVHTPIEYGDFWQYGNKEIVQYAKEHEDEYSRIVITYKYDQPYAYYLFYNKIDPSWYQNNWNFTKNGVMPRFERRIGKYEFRNINWGEDQKLKDTLFIGTPDEVPDTVSVDHIDFLNGDRAFNIAKR